MLSQSFRHQDEQFQRAFDILRSAINQRAFPSAAVAVIHQGKLIAHKGFGHFTYDATSSAVTAETTYDLASVTKVIATTTACMTLHDRGQCNLDQCVVDLLPEFASDDPRRRQVPLTAAPGSRAEYSDIGFILLGHALEKLSSEPLGQFCQREIFAKLDLAHTCFNPPADLKLAIPPTEDDRTFRHRLIQGEVNDENASVMGGIAGHAGCFSTALDVSV